MKEKSLKNVRLCEGEHQPGTAKYRALNAGMAFLRQLAELLEKRLNELYIPFAHTTYKCVGGPAVPGEACLRGLADDVFVYAQVCNTLDPARTQLLYRVGRKEYAVDGDNQWLFDCGSILASTQILRLLGINRDTTVFTRIRDKAARDVWSAMQKHHPIGEHLHMYCKPSSGNVPGQVVFLCAGAEVPPGFVLAMAARVQSVRERAVAQVCDVLNTLPLLPTKPFKEVLV